MDTFEIQAGQITSTIVTLSESVDEEGEAAESAKIELLNLSVAFSSAAFSLQKSLIDGQPESEHRILEEVAYVEMLSTYDKVRSLIEEKHWPEVDTLCKYEYLQSQDLAPRLLA